MGTGASKLTQQASKSKGIDKEIEKEKRDTLAEIKILLLGISGSGKSTISKQMKIIHLGGFSVEERRQHRNLVYFTILETLFELNWDELGVTEDEKMYSDKFFTSKEDQISFNNNSNKGTGSNASYTSNRINLITACAANSLALRQHLLSVRHILERINSSKLIQSFRSSTILSHFGSKLDDVLGDEYTPSEMDIVVTRTPTTGVSEIKFTCRSHRLRVIDVGGQRSERRKWIHCFDQVNATIFVVDLSCFDEVIDEDGVTSKVAEALRVFEEVSACSSLEETPFILFFNKMDRFQAKLCFKSLADYYPDYKGDNSYESAADYLKTKFEAAYYRSNNGVLYCYFTTATETGNIEKVFDAVIDLMVTANLKDTGMT